MAQRPKRPRSVADALEAEDRARVAAMTPRERVELALRLGEQTLDVLCAAKGMTRAEARAFVRAVRRRGRRPSVANEP